MGTDPAVEANIAVRFRYNQDFDSVYAMVPAQIAFQLALPFRLSSYSARSCARRNSARSSIST